MRPQGVLLLLGLLPGSVSAQGRPVRNGDITVLLFRTAAPQQIQVRTADAEVRRCPACAWQRGPVLLNLRAQGSSILDDAGKPLRSIALNGQAEIVSDRGQHATAAGRWRFEAVNGALQVRIEISRERYVAAVLVAEAGATEPVESLKALAVVARSFAAAVPLRHEGGALCDNTHCQALRLAPVPPRIREAVWATSGETLWVGDREVPGYFSQHCGGYTEDASAVWGGKGQPWLTAHPDAWCAHVPSQWRASLTEVDVRRALAAEGFPFAAPLQVIAIEGRDRSGRVQAVRLRAGSVTRTLPAATLRFALNRSLGWNQLRSDRYGVQRVGARVIFEGSGFGHGVGLCQAGAGAMARAGKNYREILREYFPGSSVRLQRSDTGWITIPANGFVLRTSSRDATLENEAVRAFDDARSRWSAPIQGTALLTVFPTTEAFRQATGQPGWELASTQGMSVAVQPLAVLRTHGGAEPLLRHEYLHSFVEALASPATPLWVREGLVEALNGEACDVHATVSADAVDEALRRPATLAESQRAHTAACAFVKRVIDSKGLGAARAMLRRP